MKEHWYVEMLKERGAAEAEPSCEPREDLLRLQSSVKATISSRCPPRTRPRLLLPVLNNYVQKIPAGILDCRKGCTTCCHFTVTIAPPEALSIAEFLRKFTPKKDLPALKARLQETGKQALALSFKERATRRIPCVFLAPDGACSIYPVRPLVCAGQNSMWADLCKPEEPIRVRISELEGIATALFGGLLEVEVLDRRRVRSLELASAVALALDPHLEARYVAGEDVFQAADGTALEIIDFLRPGPDLAPLQLAAVQRLVAHLEKSGRHEALALVQRKTTMFAR